MSRWSLLPWATYLVFLVFLPMGLAAFLSLCCWDFIHPVHFVGLENYHTMISDPMFWNAAKVTFFLCALQVPAEVIFGCGLALLMYRWPGQAHSNWLDSLFRTVSFIPSVISGVAVSLIGLWLFQPAGLVNQVLGWFGFSGPRWFLDPSTALLALWLLGMWGLGRSAMVFLSALGEVSLSVQEAARLDGAQGWTFLRSIVLPQLRSTAVFVAFTSFATTAQTFVSAYVATAGGPLDSTTTLVYYLYLSGFQHQRIGYASAIAVVLFMLCFGISYAMAPVQEEEQA